MRLTTVYDLIERYRVVLLDAYGVLVDASSVLAGAADLIAELNSTHKPYFIVTNDASRLPETCSRRYRELGLDIDRRAALGGPACVARLEHLADLVVALGR